MFAWRCLKAGFHMIAESSAIVCDHMETHFCDRLHTYIHTYNFICFSRLQKKAAYADVDLLKTYLKYLQHLIGLISQITLKYL